MNWGYWEKIEDLGFGNLIDLENNKLKTRQLTYWVLFLLNYLKGNLLTKKPELLAPAGNWQMLSAAINEGADAIYFGIDRLNMRAKAKNFVLEDLPKIVKKCHSSNIDTHLTLNSIVFENELEEAEEIIDSALSAGIDMFIAWDMGVIALLSRKKANFCISTQASISNSASAQLYKNFGASRIVLARECTLDQIKSIKKSVDIEIETFIHGAMCVAVSGRCFMSHHAFGKSANRGECIQNCRREYEIYDKRGDTSFLIGTDYVMSPKDLNSIEYLDLLINAGIDSFKIEGRKRSPEYIAKVVSVYRKAIDLHMEGNLSSKTKKEMFSELEKVYNRGFSSGFYFGTPSGEDYSIGSGNQAKVKKVYVGRVLNYFKKSEVAHILIEADHLQLHDNVYVIGETSGSVEMVIESLIKDDTKIAKGVKGDEVTFLCSKLIRRNDRVYKIISV